MNAEKNINFNSKNYVFELGNHKDKNVIWIIFPYNSELVGSLKNITEVFWSQLNKKWYVSDNLQDRKLFDIEPNYYEKSAFLDIAPINQPALKRYVEQFRLVADLLNKDYIVFPMMMGCRIRRAAA